MSRPPKITSYPRPPRVRAAGWISIAMGALAIMSSVGLAAMIFMNTADLDVEPGTPVGKYRLWVVLMMVGGIMVGLVPVLLGFRVMRGSLRSRYVLIGFWVIAGISAFIGIDRLTANVPFLLVLAAGIAVPVLLSGKSSYEWFAEHKGASPQLDAEARMRSNRSGTLGMIALAAAVFGLGLNLYIELAVAPGESFLTGMALDPVFFLVNVAVLWFAIRALGWAGTRRWAVMAAIVAIVWPLLASIVNLIDTAASLG